VLDNQIKRELNFALIVLVALAAFSLINIGFATTFVNSTSMTVYIKNTAPQEIFANVTPNPAVPGQTLTYRANITDINGDSLKVNITYYNTTNKAQTGGTNLHVPLNGLYYTNNTFTLSATAAAGTWSVNATISDGFTTVTNRTTFTVNSLTSTKLQNTPVDFGNQTAGLTAQRAENGTSVAGTYPSGIRGWPLIINNTGNTIANYSINGTNLVGPSKTIGVSNVTWNTTRTGEGSRSGKVALTKTTPKLIAAHKGSGTNSKVYFWLDTPRSITQQRLNGTVKIVTNSE